MLGQPITIVMPEVIGVKLIGVLPRGTTATDLALTVTPGASAEEVIRQVDRLIADWPREAPRLLVVRPIAEREATFAVDAGARYLQAGYDATKRCLLERS